MAGAPIETSERVELLDALRGFALFGILLANILYWSGWIFLDPAGKAALAGQSGAAAQYFFHHAVVDGKFYTLFSFLFGLGFALQLDRLNRRGLDGLRIFRRRLSILLLIGLLHMVLIWDGDILTFYALIGLTLPFFRNWSERLLLAAAALLIFAVPLAGHATFEALGWAPHRPIAAWSDAMFAAAGGNPADPIAWLRREEPSAFFSWTLTGWPYAISARLEAWRIPKLLGIMLLGLIAGRRLAAGTLLGDKRLLVGTLVAGLAVGLPFSLAYGLVPGQNQVGIPSLFGTVPLALAYAAAFALAWPRVRGWAGFLAWPGRMALTNYLAHSLIGIFLFYGIGLGLVGALPPLGIYAAAVLIFLLQALFSRWWLERHEQGPMEALWRIATYGGRRRAPARPA